ncbi:hypothetical protein GCM10027615_08610 [Plantactinospora veratri]
MQHGVGHGARADRLALVGVPLEGGAGHRGPEAYLGRDLAAVPAQRAVPQRLVDPLAGPVDGGRDVGEVQQRGERVGGHAVTVVAGQRGPAPGAGSGPDRRAPQRGHSARLVARVAWTPRPGYQARLTSYRTTLTRCLRSHPP